MTVIYKYFFNLYYSLCIGLYGIMIFIKAILLFTRKKNDSTNIELCITIIYAIVLRSDFVCEKQR